MAGASVVAQPTDTFFDCAGLIPQKLRFGDTKIYYRDFFLSDHAMPIIFYLIAKFLLVTVWLATVALVLVVW